MDEGLTFDDKIEKMREVTSKKIRDVAIKCLPSSREDGNYVLLLRDPLKK